jgi:hypothetical protein
MPPPRPSATRVPNRKPVAATVARSAASKAPAVNAAATDRKVVPAVKKVVDAAMSASTTLQQIKDSEALEAERAKMDSQKKLAGGELKWYQYLTPADTRDIQQCAELDEYNHSVFQSNNAMLERVNQLMSELGKEKVRLNPPTKYVPIATAKYEEMLFDDSFRVMAGIKFLAERQIYPIRDYPIELSYERADKIAEDEEIKRLVEAGEQSGGIDISSVAGRGHKDNCTCENRWDGRSERCRGDGLRFRWKRAKGHHFLRPRIVPETY